MERDQRIIRLSDLIKITKLSQFEFAEKVGVSESYVSHLLIGRKPISEKFVDKLVHSLRIRRNWFNEGTGQVFDDYGYPEEVTEQSINDRIAEVRRKMRMSQNEFSKELGFSPGYISSLETDAKSISKSFLYQLQSKLNVNPIWIETGEGDMFEKKEPEHVIKTQDSVIVSEKEYSYSKKSQDYPAQTTAVLDLPEPEYHEGKLLKDYLERFDPDSINEFAKKLGVVRATVYNTIFKNEVIDGEYRQKIEEVLGMSLPEIMNKIMDDQTEQRRRRLYRERKGYLPLFNSIAQGGSAEMFMNDSPEYIQEYIDIPGFKDCMGYLTVWGNSMYPEYCAGEIIAVKEIVDKEVIPYGEAFVVVTSEQRMIKYIFPGDSREEWSMVSQMREKFPPFPVRREKVIRLYLVKGKITKKAM